METDSLKPNPRNPNRHPEAQVKMLAHIIAEQGWRAECYGEAEIWERHRHRYEFNNEFRQEMQDAGLVISGTSPEVAGRDCRAARP